MEAACARKRQPGLGRAHRVIRFTTSISEKSRHTGITPLAIRVAPLDGGLVVVSQAAYTLTVRVSLGLCPLAHRVFGGQASVMAVAILRASSCSMNGT